MPITRRRRANPPEQPENNNHLAGQNENPSEPLTPEQTSSVAPVEEEGLQAADASPSAPVSNGERNERQADQPEYLPTTIEGGRRTARGELFRRPPQAPTPPPVAAAPAATPAPQQPQQLQPPTHEISLPLGKESILHLAYNPGYTGADEARMKLLHQLSDESKAGGRARCWNCGAIAIAYERWNTRSKAFGEIGIAYCEICGVWSVM